MAYSREEKRVYNKKYYEENLEKKRAYNKKYYEENPEYYKKYYEENLEKERARKKKWREENPEKIRAYDKKYREENPEYYKKYREENPEKCRASNKKWREENPEYYKKYREENPEKFRAYDKKWREENKTEKPSVIYVIECKATNKYYIGQTGVWFERRVIQHKSKLKNDDHSAIEMQDDYNIHGPDAFEYSILKELDSQATGEELLREEKKFIKKFLSEDKQLYNNIDNLT